MLSCMRMCGMERVETGGLLEAGNECRQLAEETSEVCETTKVRGENVLSFAKEIGTSLSSLSSKPDPGTFMTIMDLLDGDRMKDTIALTTELDDLALVCRDKSNRMMHSMERGTETLPPEIKEPEAETDTEGEFEDPEELLYVEDDINDLEECTKDLESMNLFSASRRGTRAFNGLIAKGPLVGTVYEQIKELCASVAKLSQSFMMDSCCAQVAATYESVKEMLKCIRLTKLIQQLADWGKRLISAVGSLLKVAWSKFQHFMEEFGAAKKLQHWVNGLNPLTSPAGKVIRQAASLLGYGSAVPGGNSSSGSTLLGGCLG